MANRYWVGGTGSWDSTSHWSISSGGPSGASVPDESDNAYFDGNSFSADGQSVTYSGLGIGVLDMDWTGVSKTVVFNVDILSVGGQFIANNKVTYNIDVLGLSGSSKSFVGGSLNYKTVYVTGTGLLILGSNHFENLYIDKGVTVNFEAGSTTTVDELAADGTETEKITLQSNVSGTKAEIKKMSGYVRVRYCNIQDIACSGGAVFEAGSCTNRGGNLGWSFKTIVGQLTSASSTTAGLMAPADKRDLDDLFVRATINRVGDMTAGKTNGTSNGVTFSAFRAYLPSGTRVDCAGGNITFDAPAVTSVNSESHTVDADGKIHVNQIPIVNTEGNISASEVVVKLASNNSTVTVTASDPANGELTTALAENTAVNVTYKYALSRYDTVYVNSSGTLVKVVGTPGAPPVKPSVPDGSLEISSILVEAKTGSFEIDASDIRVKKSGTENGYNIVVATSEPSDKFENMFWLNPSTEALKRWSGLLWNDVSGGGSSSNTGIACVRSSFTPSSNGTTVCQINNGQFNKNLDYLQVFLNNMILYQDVDYTLDSGGESITLVKSIDTDDTVHYFDWKNVVQTVLSYDGSLLVDGSVTRAKLASAVTAELDTLDSRIDSIAEEAGGNNNLVLMHSNESVNTTETSDYTGMIDGSLFADFNRHKSKLRIGLVTKGYGDLKIGITDGTTAIYSDPIAVDLADWGKKFVTVECSTLSDMNSNKTWMIILMGKADTSQTIYVKRFNVQASPVDQLSEPTLLLVTPLMSPNNTTMALLDTKYFPMNYAIDYACIAKCYASVLPGTGVTGVELKFELVTTNGVDTSTEDATLTYTEDSIKGCEIPFPNVVAPYVKVNVYGRVSAGAGNYILGHYEVWLGV